jgi:hypothetical protein
MTLFNFNLPSGIPLETAIDVVSDWERRKIDGSQANRIFAL